MASRKIEDCHIILRNAWQLAEKEWNVKYPKMPKPFLTCTHRSNEEQTKLYADGRTNKKLKKTNAQAGESPHNYNPSLAFDVAFVTLAKRIDWSAGNFKRFADIIKAIDNRVEWGGNFQSFKDNPHFELNNWKEYLNK